MAITPNARCVCVRLCFNHVNASPLCLWLCVPTFLASLGSLDSSFYLVSESEHCQAQFHTKNAIKCDAFHYPSDLYFSAGRAEWDCERRKAVETAEIEINQIKLPCSDFKSFLFAFEFGLNWDKTKKTNHRLI